MGSDLQEEPTELREHEAISAGRAGHQTKKIAELNRENAALAKENKQLKAKLKKLEQEKAKWGAVKRELVTLRREVENLKALGVNLRHRLFGRKSEKQEIRIDEVTEEPLDDGDSTDKPHRCRGQQVGSRGHGRRIHQEIAPEIIVHEVDACERVCPRCGRVYEEIGRQETSEEIDWDVVIRRKVHHRKLYRRTCRCSQAPAFIKAAVPAKLIPKGLLSCGAVAHLLVEKFGMGRPISNSLRLMNMACGSSISEGTVAGVMQKVAVLLEPLYEKIIEHSRLAQHWHADETGWKVYEEIEGKSGHKWWLWIFSSCDTAAFVLDPTRSSRVVREHLSRQENVLAKRILSTDMYKAYSGLEGIISAYCWSHVRRRFLETGQGYPEALGSWSREWVGRIGRLYQLNNERLDKQRGCQEYEQAEARLREFVGEMERILYEQIADPGFHGKGKDVLHLVARHWKGLVVFLDHPEVPLDNNEAERLLRGPVVGRKNFYGSGAVWSGQLTARALSILATAAKNGLNPLTYLKAYLTACAQAGGKAPDSVERFLPWVISDNDRSVWSRAPTDTP